MQFSHNGRLPYGGQVTLANEHFATIDDLEEAQAARCVALQERPDLIRSTTGFSWWPKRVRKLQQVNS